MELYGSLLNISGSVSASAFTGSFIGDGSGLYNLPASGVTGLNLSQISTGSISASLSPDGFNVNTDTSITGSLIVSGDTQISGALTASGLIYPTTDALLDKQFITSDTNGNLSWDDVHTIYEHVQAGEPLVKTDPIYLSGSVGAIPIAYKSIASDPTTMPAVYVMDQNLNTGEEGRAIALGLIDGIDLTGLDAGDIAYVGSTGGWTTTRPTGTDLIQPLGVVTKGGNGGKGFVFNAGVSDLPNIATNKLWIGDTNAYPIEKTIGEIGLATTGSNLFMDDQTISGSIIPSVDNLYDLGSPTHQWRDVYISSGSLYVDGTKVISSTTQELTITTDTGQSIKILEAGSDSIVLQTADGDIELKSSGGGDVLLDPTNGLISIKGTTQIQDGHKITSSGGTNIVFGDGVIVSGSIELTGTIDGIDLAQFKSDMDSMTGSNDGRLNNIETTTASFDGRLDNIETSTSSLNSFTSSIDTTIKTKLDNEDVISGSIQVDITGTTGYVAFSSSIATTDLNQENRLDTIESHYVTTGSNSFHGDQTITGSLTITQQLTVLGSSSILYVTTSQLAVSSSVISVNVFEPAERFGGLKVYDSGSLSHQATASLLWDSEQNHWIYQNASGSMYSGGMFLSGPRNTGSLGEEVGITFGKIPKSVGGDHLDNSIMNEDGSTIHITGSLSATGTVYGTNISALETESGSIRTDFNSYTSSNNTTNNTQNGRLNSLETTTSSLDSRLDSLESATSSYSTTDYFVTGATFGTGDGIITLTRNDGNTVTVDVDGRFLPLGGGTITGDILISSSLGSSYQGTFTDYDTLTFDNSFSDIARGPNKIILYNDVGSTWVGGFGIHDNTVSYYSGGTHKWYETSTGPTYTNLMTLSETGNLSTLGTITGAGITSTAGITVSGTSYYTFNKPSTSGYQTVALFGSTNNGVFITSDSGIISRGAYYNNGWIATSETGAYVNFNTSTGGMDLNVFSGGTVGNAVSFTELFVVSRDNFSFNGNAIYHAGNLSNLNQLSNGPGYIATGTTITHQASWTTATKFKSGGDISQAAGNHSLQIFADTNNDAFMAFHISGDYAVHFGLDDTTNRLYVGGWSDGTGTKYQMWDSRDFSSTNVSNWNTAYGWGNHAGLYMTQGQTRTDINTINNGGNRYDPSANNPTNEHYAVLTYGNGGNVTGQLATHFVNGQLYSRGYNSSWSSWKKYVVEDSGTWGINISGNAATATSATSAGTATNSSQLNGLSSTQLFNNMGQNHSTVTDFNSVSDFGFRYVQGSTNGPGTGSSQFYGFSIGLGNDYAFSNYALQFAIPRYIGTDKYLSVRTREATTWGSWSKIYAGYADSAGSAGSASSVPWTGISSGRRTDYSIGFQAPASSYAGFEWFGSNGNSAGYMLVRGTSDNDVYTAEGITIVADQGWLTLAQRTAASKGVRIMTGASSATRLSVESSGQIIVHTADQDIRVNRGRFQVYNNAGTGNLGYRIRTDENGGWRWQFVDGGNTEYFGVEYSSGNVSVAGTLTESSSIRYKKDIIDLEYGLKDVLSMRPVTYKKKETDLIEIGLIAEEVADIVPEVIQYNEDNVVDGLNYSRLTAVLVNAIKELNSKVEDLEKKLNG